jgi:hypothetical protein
MNARQHEIEQVSATEARATCTTTNQTRSPSRMRSLPYAFTGEPQS